MVQAYSARMGLSMSGYVRIHSTRLKTLNSVLVQHKALFEEGLRTIEPYRAIHHINPDAIPKFHKPRPVPFAIKGTIGWDLTERKGRAL